VIDGGLAAPGLLAWVATQKFLDHLPLYRVEQICARQGVPIARSTLAEWVGRIGVALQPLSERLAELLKQRSILHADETPVPQLDPGKGKTHRAYLWAYRSCDLDHGPPILVFDYQPGRSGQHVRHFLQGWRGHLMVDDYSGYKALFHAGVTELACLAHARRKFFDLHAANQNPFAAEALQRIAALYRIEQDAKECSVAQRKALRQSASQPLLDALHDWLLQARRKTADGSGLARAIDYSLRRWPALQRYATQGEFPIDNNPIENAIRPIAIGKKNWLFAGSERAGMRAAAIQSLLGTAKLNGIEPTVWLKETLEKLPTWPNSRIDELLPLRRDTTI
jgi:transposase